MISFCALWLSSMALLAQSDSSSLNEDDEQAGTSLTVIPRVDFNPSFSTGDGEGADVNWFTPTLYTVLEGNIGEHVSYYLSNHWLTYHPEDLYKNTFHSDNSSWVDMANINYDFNCGLSLGLGKYCMALGSFEEDADDWDAHSISNFGSTLASSFWNGMMVYEWGLNVSYAFDDCNTLTAQMLASPFAEKPFSPGLYSYHLQWRGEFDRLSILASGNLLETRRGTYDYVIGTGLQYAFTDRLTGTLDALRYCDADRDGDDDQFFQLQATAQYALSDKLDLTGRFGYETGESYSYGLGYGDDVFYGGVSANYYPLQNNRDLRLHATAAMHNQYDEAWLTIGATYFLSLDF